MVVMAGGKDKAAVVTFGIKSAGKQVRNNKKKKKKKRCPFEGKDSVFFLTRDLTADALADSKGHKGEVNRGNRKKCFVLDNNKVFLYFSTCFCSLGPWCFGKVPVASAPAPSRGSGCHL